MESTRGLGRLGFTLLECMVSLLVGSLVVLAVQTVVQTTLDLTAFRPERDVALASLRTEAVRVSVREWLEGVNPPVGTEALALEGRDREHAGLPTDELTFVTLDGGFLLGEPRDRPLRLRLRVSVAAGLTLEYAEPDSAAAGVLGLLPDVQGLDVRYLPDAPAGSAEWVDSWSGADLPRAIELRFHPAPGRSLPRALRSPLLVRPGPG